MTDTASSQGKRSPQVKCVDDGDTHTTQADDRCCKLADEILDAQRARADLLKWKLIIIAGLGAAGLGLVEQSSAFPLLLALIPFVCLYVDLLCNNLNMRIHVIGAYYRQSGNRYERFTANCHFAGVFKLEEGAIFGSTVILSFLVAAFGGYYLINDALIQTPVSANGVSTTAPSHALSFAPVTLGFLLVGAGLCGTIGAFLLKKVATRCIEKIGTASPIQDA